MSEKIINVFDFQMIIDTVDVGVSRSLDTYKMYENDDIEMVKKEIDKNSTMIDIGAHIGLYTLIFSKFLDNGKIISFEPSSHNYSILEKNIKLNNCNNVILNKNAVYSKNMEVDLHVNNYNTGDNRIYYPGIKRQIEKVSAITIDTYLMNNEYINNISFIKIDTQGVELAVLQGCEKTLLKYHPKILFEYWPRGLKEYGSTEEELLNFLINLGYKIYRNGKEFYYDLNQKIDYINLLAKST